MLTATVNATSGRLISEMRINWKTFVANIVCISSLIVITFAILTSIGFLIYKFGEQAIRILFIIFTGFIFVFTKPKIELSIFKR